MRFLLIAAILLAAPAVAQEPGFVPPDWIKKPSWEDLNAVWPREAMKKGLDGRAVLSCTLTARGLLEACTVREETPAGEGFGAAALLLTPSFVLKPATQDGKLTDCKPDSATPEGLGFSEAAVQVAGVMQKNPWSDGGGPVDGVRIKLPIRFELAPGVYEGSGGH